MKNALKKLKSQHNTPVKNKIQSKQKIKQTNIPFILIKDLLHQLSDPVLAQILLLHKIPPSKELHTPLILG